MGIPLKRGRHFDRQDTIDSPMTVITCKEVSVGRTLTGGDEFQRQRR
jgi:hypothetical protein